MKSLFKKSLLVLMVAFIAVFTLSITNKVVAQDVTITFNDTSKRTEFTTSKQVWAENGITVTNDKSSSTSNVGDYANPARFYKSSKLTIEYSENISKIVFDCNSSSYATAMKNSISSDLGTSTVSSDKVTLTLATPSNEVVVSSLSGGQVRMDGLTITTASSDEDVASVSVAPESVAYAFIGNTVKLNATLENISGTTVWSSNNTDIATVDANGLVTAKAMGKVTIIATVGDVKGSCDITVYPSNEETITISQAIEIAKMAGTAYSEVDYTIEGRIVSIENTQYGNFNLTDGTNTLYIYGLYSADGNTRYDALSEKPVAGDEVVIKGPLGQFGSTNQMKNAKLIEFTHDENIDVIKGALNSVEAHMSIAYKYTVSPADSQVATISEIDVTDTLNRALTGREGTSYASWSGKQSNSSAVWAGQSAGGNDSIQLRSSNSNSGIVTTTSGGKVSKVIIAWNSNTSAGRTLDVYGKNTAYTNPTELYATGDAAEGAQGTKLGSIVMGTSTELEITGDYQFIGLRSYSGAMYIDSITVVWKTESNSSEDADVYSNVDFRLKCGIDNSIEELVDLPEGKTYTWGIEISDGTNSKCYAESDDVNFIIKDETNEINYVIISLGDVLTEIYKAKREFTVKAYVIYDGQTYYSSQVKTYSVASILSYYQTNVDLTTEQQNSVDAAVELLEKLGCYGN